MELFTPDFGLIFWMFVAFGVLFLILWRFAWPVILKAVDERADLIDKGVEYARAAQAQLDDAKASAQQFIDEARHREADILREADRMKSQIIEEARSAARVEAQKEIDAAKVQIAQQQKQAEEELRAHISDIALQIADKVVRGQLADSKEQEKLVDNLLTEIEHKN